jgi:hypothetical protein
MDNNTANVYLLDDKYTSIYVNLTGYEQIIFYWSLTDNCQKRKPKWRVSKETIQEDMEILSYNNLGCVLKINGRTANFEWGEFSAKNSPAYRGQLTNFADWEYDPEFKPVSPTSAGDQYSGYYSGHYSQPQDYESD